MSHSRSIAVLFVTAVAAGLLLGSGCPPQTTDGTGGTDGTTITGNATNGQAKFTSTCSGCHRAGGIGPVLGADDANKVVNNLSSITTVHGTLTLTDQEVADLKAFLATQ